MHIIWNVLDRFGEKVHEVNLVATFTDKGLAVFYASNFQEYDVQPAIVDAVPFLSEGETMYQVSSDWNGNNFEAIEVDVPVPEWWTDPRTNRMFAFMRADDLLDAETRFAELRTMVTETYGWSYMPQSSGQVQS